MARELVLSHVHRREFYSSGSGAVVVVQHAAQALAPLDLTCVAEMANRAAKRDASEENHEEVPR